MGERMCCGLARKNTGICVCLARECIDANGLSECEGAYVTNMF